jgi:short-subunit dehydrogenase
MKRVIVIGATSGIGKGLAGLLAVNDYKVGITGRRTDLLQALKAENDSYLIQTFDITDVVHVVEKLEMLTSELGGLDLLVLCSGTGDENEPLDFEIEKRTIDTNVTGFTVVADWAFNYFQAQKFGHFAAISSIAGLRGGRQAPAYNATKAYQMNYLEGLRQRAYALRTLIFVTDIRPGFVDTNMAKGAGLFWVMPVEKAVAQIFRAIRNKKKVVYVTRRWGFIAFVLKRMPRFLFDRM